MEKKEVFSTSLIYFVVVCLFVTIRILNGFNLFSFMGEAESYVLSGVLQVGVLFLLSVVMFKTINKKTFRATFEDFNYRKVSIKVILIAFGLGVVIYLLNVFVSSFFSTILQSLGYHYGTSSGGEQNGWTLVLSLIFVALMPAVCEETLHRGMLLNGTRGLGMKKCILINGLMFGLMHLNIEQFFYATLIGFFLGFVVYVTGSIYPCMIIHFMNNGIGVVLSFMQNKNLLSGGVFVKLNLLLSSNPILGTFIIFLIVFALVFLLYFLTRTLIRCSVEDDFRLRKKELSNLLKKFTYFGEVDKITNDSAEDDEELSNELSNLNRIKNLIDEHPEAVVIRTKKVKFDFKTKAFFWASASLMALCTLFSFIWGVI